MDFEGVAQDIYPDAEFGFGVWNYQPIINYFGEVLVQVDDGGYQGDSRVLLRDNEKYGILIFGWGSCSGCDALQACRSYQDIDELIGKLANKMKWFDTAEECLRYVENKDWEREWHWHVGNTKHFVEEVKEYLKEANNE